MNQDVETPFPHSVQAEKSVVSVLLQWPQETIAKLSDICMKADYFYLPVPRKLYETALEMDAAGKEVELVGLIQHLIDRGKLDEMGGPSAVTDIYTYQPTPTSLEAHSAIVREKYLLREVMSISTQSHEDALTKPDDAWSVMESLEDATSRLRGNLEQQTTNSTEDILNDIADDIKSAMSGEKNPHGIPTGYPEIDSMTGGLNPGEVFVIAARPSMGKTALMMNIVENACLDNGVPTMVFSCEMTKKSLFERLLFGRSGVNPKHGTSAPTKGDLCKMRNSFAALKGAPLYVDDTSQIKVQDFRVRAKRAIRTHGVEFIAIDYLQLMRSGSKQSAASREREVSEIMSGIKALAKDENIPVILLCQLNRSAESRTGAERGVPRMSDLRESGSIEQDADVIGLLYRKAYYAQAGEDTDGSAQLDLVKNRNGQTGKQYLTFIPEKVKFEPSTIALQMNPSQPTNRYAD